ncbi:neurexin-4 isoform X2 [Aphidius gifuensis]|uniref:neurexin-4 isoform X2 n=1 Tax=Aphidius gifuensis TaxID=684658 RepID=UPI001CDC2C44|nr:neurexin-4 isoform X2 [Aphidius gifuensis]XP_044018100.1 neurexin-4 isoform X2 [Aphidius gifuensis]
MNIYIFIGYLLTAIVVPITTAYDYDCNDALLDRAHLKATSYMKDREPTDAVLNGEKAWTASTNDKNQYLIIDLGQVMNISMIATQGRENYGEYVMEYSISYGTNNLDYVDYKEEEGNTKMFKGNINADKIKLNRFDVPIIAQWIRINPTRWRDRISMRVELYGCNYESDVINFNGTSLVRMDLLREPIETYHHSIRFRFKTNNADGVLMYSRGTQGDFIALQLRDNRMLLNIDLGSKTTTSFSVGSLLDDNMWHDVLISRNRKDINFSVDRVLVKGKIIGEFHRLDLNRALYIGGVPNIQDGLKVTQNFTGCIENFFLNQTSLFKSMIDADATGENLQYHRVNTIYACPQPQMIPVTFLTTKTHAILKAYNEGSPTMNVSLAFRTYEERGLIVYHKFTSLTSQDYIKLFLENGKIKIQIKTDNEKAVILDNFDEKFNDGKWHQIILTVSKNSIILNVDSRPMRTKRILNISTGSVYLIGGGIFGESSNTGFVGCMRAIRIEGNERFPTDWKDEDYCCKNEIVFDACQMLDRCNPNPCKHDGICGQNSYEFYCDCSNTGYTGAVCHTSLNSLSCEAYKNMNPVNQRADIKIDVDGSGPLEPFPVTCEFYADGRVMTVVRHSNELSTPVDGFDEPGSFIQDINYDANFDQIEALLNRSTTCRQRINYACKHSKLFNTPVNQMDLFRPNSWWISRNNQKMDYWGGALPGSRKCECGVLGNCADPTKWCNCDSDLEGWFEDGGDITEKEYLPVRQLRLGDTGTPLDEKEGRYTLGSLICEGDDLFKNVVTFRVSDATINLPTFDMGHSGDIYFEFKTTMPDAVIINSKGPTDYIKISITSGNQLQFQYQAGDGPLTVNLQTSYMLTDNNWHSVSVERNRKQARVVLDGALKSELKEPPGPVRALHLTSDFVVGATTDYRDGFVGCIRALLLNGKQQDLRTYARRGIYGVSENCIGKCESNPCLNNGTCHEKYDGYSCDCRWTAFKGPICADEIGVNMGQNSMIKYDFSGSWRSTISEKIRVGFTTTNPRGFLLGFFSNVSGEYLTIMVSNSGSLRVVFDFGFERQEVILSMKHFGLGQYHDLRFSRKNSGATMVLQVDDNQPKEFNFDIKASADAQFNNIQYMYIGKNETMTEGFVGCISRVEFDDIYPLKLLFQQNGPGNVRSLGAPLTEDFCGVEPVTHPPDIPETRPPIDLDEDKLRAAYNETDTALLGGVLAFIIIALIIMAILIGRYQSRHKGEYLTQEDKGAEMALDPDSAVVHSTTGHQVQKKKEWFI